MIVAIHQPNLFPRLKILQKLALADIWVVLDNVQYCQREYQNRTLIVPSKGKEFWCTIPVHLPSGQSTKIKDVEFASIGAIDKINQTLKCNFVNNENNISCKNKILTEIKQHENNFAEFVVASTTILLEIAEVCPKVVYASQLGETRFDKNERLIDLCKAVGGDTYIADSGGAHYIDVEKFKDNQVSLLWQVWETPQNESAVSMKNSIRNSSSLNILMRSKQDFIDAVLQSKISRKRIYAEGK